jgi:predicted nucleotidyltransferase
MGTISKLANEPPKFYFGAEVPMRVIRKFARDVAQRFKPDKIVLFGSYAYGTPNENSDVDILVVMPCRNQLDQAVKISYQINPPFPLDIIVRKPAELQWRLQEGESFSTEITSKGKILYEKDHARDTQVSPRPTNSDSRSSMLIPLVSRCSKSGRSLMGRQ